MTSKLMVGISLAGEELPRPDDDGTDPFHVLDPDRARQKAYADEHGYFWSPCSRCGRWSGGHEWAALMRAGADNVNPRTTERAAEDPRTLRKMNPKKKRAIERTPCMENEMSKKKNKHNTSNPRLCALRVADPPAFVKEVTTAIEKHDGNIAQAAKELDIERRTLFLWLEDYPQLKRATKEARANVV